jgi:hypothetical protein
MEEQEEYFKQEIDMLEGTISQLGNIRNNKEIKLELEVVQHNADLRSQLAYFKSGRMIESVLRERSLLI